MDLGLGIDTGGTYTDAVIVDMKDGRVLCKAKALTTHHDLAQGIEMAIEKLDHMHFLHVGLMAISSTLATNAVVEGKGCRVGLIVIGHEIGSNIPVDEIVEIQGGHNLHGVPQSWLGIDQAKEFVTRVKNRVDAFAVSSYLSIRNPEHENIIKNMIHSISSSPVVCGHELSSALGFHERTITAVLNARLIPIVSDLIQSIKKVQERMNLNVPLMIVRGDGALMSETMARERPVETILSGPAASVIGAKTTTGHQDAVIVDVGGTTTDIGILRSGQPRLDAEGAMIGGRRTRVRAIDVFTSGIGGDSRIVVAGGKISLCANRAVPLCIGASSNKIILEKLRVLLTAHIRPVSLLSDLDNVPQATEFFVFSKDLPDVDLAPEHRKLLDMMRIEPRSFYELAGMANVHLTTINLKKLEALGMIYRVGLTPTDILHADGSYIEYDAVASKIAVGVQACQADMKIDDFIRAVMTLVEEKIAIDVVKKLIYEEIGEVPYDGVGAFLIENMIRGTGRQDLTCRPLLNKPIIGIGAPVKAYLPGVADRLNTKLVLPEHSEVGNAIGAISGNVVESIEMLIRPLKGLSMVDNPPCTLFWLQERKDFESTDAAINYAKEVGSNLVQKRAIESGVDSIEIIIENKRNEARINKSQRSSLLLDITLVITAIGKPQLFFES
ncbi:MAG: hydantoinase/oxoprolinase family protein [Methanomassiliicoccus sp.]|nr:hydantoinase/oxoprolinase family protein [Methanomassiliicoccus sp.]